MKLLFCSKCWDVFKLAREMRQCFCGDVKGHYLADGHNAVVNGKGHSLAIGNGSLQQAIFRVTAESVGAGDKDHFIDTGRIEYAWVRPHTGTGNPRCTIDPDLDTQHEQA